MSAIIQVAPSITDTVLTFQHDEHVRTLIVGTPAWNSWLQTATIFTFTSENGTFTARRERAGNKRGGWYWRAYQKHAGRLHRVYLGRSEELTLDRLNAAAARLTGHSEIVKRARSRHASAERASRDDRLFHVPADRSWHRGEREPWTAVVQRASSTLPSPLTSLVGREQEVVAISSLLATPDVREVTITGTGGVGKTRLALAVAARVESDFVDGICFVSLAALRDADLVASAIAQAEGLTNTGTSWSAVEALQALLRERRHLLVLDNFEQVIAAAPALVSLLAGCPHLKVLVTSRELLRVRGEREFVVQPLTLPVSKHESGVEALAHYGAAALFMERAREVQPALELTARTAPLIAEICRRLEGLPLAIELAAARLKVLSLEALLERLGHRLQILTGGPRDLPARQQTMRQTIVWSYELLSEEEKRLFRLLSVFPNGCTLDAAEAVFSAHGGERARVLDGVTSLLDKHLLHRSEPDTSALRLLMHETIREYGLDVLVANQELEMARRVHAEYYLGLAQSYLESSKLAVLLGQLEWEHANLRAALEWALERPASEVAGHLASTLFAFLEGSQRLTGSPTVARGPMTSSQDKPVTVTEGTFPAPEAAAPEPSSGRHSETRAREPGESQGRVGGVRHVAVSLYLLGLIAWIVGDFGAAYRYGEEGLARARGPSEKVTAAYLIDLLGQVALDQGEDGRAQALLEDGFALHQQAGDVMGSLNALFFLERALLAVGNVAQARARAEEHLALSRAIGFPSGAVGALTFLGRLALEEGDAARASELFEESLPILGELGENLPLAVATNLQGIGVTLAKQGRLTDAARLWSAAQALCPILPEERAHVARALAAVRTDLGDEAFATAWAEGQTMTVEQALAEVGYAAHTGRVQTRASKSSGRAGQRGRYTHDLTEREVEVLRLVARGLTDAQIADALIISPRTVNAHLRSIYAKLNISSRNAATYFALEHNLL